jgi:hypothetical protein
MYCCHESYFISESLLKNVLMVSEVLSSELVVDSGQLGFFDSSILSNFDESDYEKACDLTLETDDCFGVSDNYTLSSSGFGDGCYFARALKNAEGEFIAFRAEFISDDYDYEYEYDL